ncbi:MAG: class I SAM-dependent methyltransferase [Actinobacteria bacterium]|nr:class I SAM-dependent methyltransferase [Actinomycetota bacterium]
MTLPNQKITSEWEGFKGRIGAWYLNSPLRRVSEIFFLGDLRTKFLEKVNVLLKEDEIVLDVGAGSGYFSVPIAERLKEGKVICFDLSSVMLEKLKKNAKKKNVSSKIEVRLGNAYQLELGDSTVDLATSNGVLHELSQPQKALDEIIRVLKPGGLVVISDFRNTSVGRRIAVAHREGDHGPFSLEEFKTLLSDTGFLNVKVDAIRHWVLASGQKKQP